jgi:hypothetical protein
MFETFFALVTAGAAWPDRLIFETGPMLLLLKNQEDRTRVLAVEI